MSDKGKAAVWVGAKKIELMDLPIPEVREDGMLIKVGSAGVCGTDGHLFPQDPPYPSILGHEFAGTIVEMGSKANSSMNVYGGSLKVGDRIVVYPWITCNKCQGCLSSRPGTCTTCDNSFVYGIPYPKLGLEGDEKISSNVNVYPYFKGGFAEYTYILPETYMWKIPDDMPLEVAVLLDPTAVAVRSIELACTAPGIVEEGMNTNSKVVILGDGPVGVLTALAARLMGVEQIIMVGGVNYRLEVAKKFANVDEVINYHEASSDEKIKMVKKLTGGRGADVVFQSANQPIAFVEGLEMLRRMGTIVEVGNMVNTGSVVDIEPSRQICLKHATIKGMSANHPEAFNKAFHLLKRYKSIPFEMMFSHKCNLNSLEKTLNSMKEPNYLKGLMINS